MAAVHLLITLLCRRQLSFVVALLLCSQTVIATPQVPVLEWCLDHYPNRHSFVQDPATPSANKQDPYGPTVELMRELALRAGFVLKFSPDTPFARCLKQMASGKTDLMINLNYSAERAAYMHLLPYSQGLPEVLYLNHNQTLINEFEQLRQTTIAIVRGYVYAENLLQQFKGQQLTVHEADTLSNAFGLLLLNRVEAVVAPQQQAAYVIASESLYQGKFRSIPLAPDLVTELHTHLGFSKKSANPQLLAPIQRALEQMVNEGKIASFHPVLPMQQRPATSIID